MRRQALIWKFLILSCVILSCIFTEGCGTVRFYQNGPLPNNEIATIRFRSCFIPKHCVLTVVEIDGNKCKGWEYSGKIIKIRTNNKIELKAGTHTLKAYCSCGDDVSRRFFRAVTRTVTLKGGVLYCTKGCRLVDKTTGETIAVFGPH